MSPVHRELGLLLLSEQAEFVGSEMHHMGDLVQPILLAGLSASETAVQVRQPNHVARRPNTVALLH